MKLEFPEIPPRLDRLATSEEIQDAVLLSQRDMEFADTSLWTMISHSEYYAAIPGERGDRMVLVERLSKVAN